MAKPKIYQVDQLQTMVGSMNTAITAAHNQANSAYTQANTASNTSNLVLKTGDTMTGQLNISSGGLLVTGNSNFDSGTLFVDSVNDRIGIGTTSPTDKFQIEGTGTVPVASIRSTTTGSVNQAALNLFRGDSTNGFAQFGVGTTSTNSWQFGLRSGSTSWQLYDVGASTSRVVVDTSGNVGIGKTSIDSRFKLQTSAANVGFMLFKSGAGAEGYFLNLRGDLANNDYNLSISAYDHSGDTNTDGLSLNGYDGISFCTGSNSRQERMRIDTNGNVGIGSVPGAWDTGNSVRAIQISSAGALWNYSNNNIYLTQNILWNGTNRVYTVTGSLATEYSQQNGTFVWFNAPSGTAGNTVTMTERMRITSNGNVGIGTSSPSYKLDVTASTTTGTAGIRVAAQFGSGVFGAWANYPAIMYDIGSGVLNPVIVYDTNNSLNQLYTANTERVRITGTGEVYIAGFTDQGAYNLQVSGTGIWAAGAYVNGSDRRLKRNIKPLDAALEIVKNIKPVTFQYNEDYSKDQNVQPGFIAQELQEALSGTEYADGIVHQGKEYLNVAYQNLIPLLTKAIQELKAELDNAKAEIAALKNA